MSKLSFKKRFEKRIRTLKLDNEAKDKLYAKFLKSWNHGFFCLYCRVEMDLDFEHEHSFTIDHTVPKVSGGQDTVENLEFVCRDCNFLKSGMSAEAYLHNMKRLKGRKRNREYWKAKKASKKDERTRDAFKEIFESINAEGAN